MILMEKGSNRKRLARTIQTLDKLYYERGNQQRCHKQIWRQHGYPLFGLGYGTYMKCLKTDVREIPALKTSTVDTLRRLDTQLGATDKGDGSAESSQREIRTKRHPPGK